MSKPRQKTVKTNDGGRLTFKIGANQNTLVSFSYRKQVSALDKMLIGSVNKTEIRELYNWLGHALDEALE